MAPTIVTVGLWKMTRIPIDFAFLTLNVQKRNYAVKLTYFLYLITLYEIPIDLISQPGFFWRMHQALLIYFNVLDQPVLVCSAGWKYLIIVAVVNSHRNVQIGGIVKGVAPMVDLELHAERVGQVRSPNERRYASGYRHIAPQHIGGLL